MLARGYPKTIARNVVSSRRVVTRQAKMRISSSSLKEWWSVPRVQSENGGALLSGAYPPKGRIPYIGVKSDSCMRNKVFVQERGAERRSICRGTYVPWRLAPLRQAILIVRQSASKVISAKSGNDYESNYPSYFNTGYTFNVVGGLSQLIVQRECLVSRLVREVLPARGSV
ncbi:hypothetical protein BHM03_00023493 [Ensete ventricosum]|nr:hypothetical protein BHM03_00023493 [Ensete ventricosum]